MRSALLLVLIGALAAGEAVAALTAWPAVVCADEAHRVAFRLQAAAAGTAMVGWDGAEAPPFAVPEGASEGLLALPAGLGLHRGAASCDGATVPLAIRLADVAQPWPIAGLRDGLPVDADGVPVVLVGQRRSANDARRARLAATAPSRPGGRPVLVGDPLEGGWSGLDAEQLAVAEARFPHHAALAALAAIDRPRSVVWSPGNGALFARTWPGEGRLCAALSERLAARGLRPRLVLALPPAPVASAWADDDVRRRQELAAHARAAGWELLDLAAAAGDPRTANRLAAGLYAENPVGAALERVRMALREELAR